MAIDARRGAERVGLPPSLLDLVEQRAAAVEPVERQVRARGCETEPSWNRLSGVMPR